MNNKIVRQIKCSSREELYLKVANQCAVQLNRGVEKYGRASFIVPGGTTPAPVFEKLSNMSLDWHKILVAPSDERWVEPEHEQSNQGLIKSKLLVNHASKAGLMALKNEAQTPKLGEVIAEKNIGNLAQPFDVVLLGMGGDGHFASLFPGIPELSQALDINNENKCIGINAEGCSVAGDYTQRMSLTLSALLNSKLIILMITGAQKLQLLDDATKQNDSMNLPITALINQTKTPLEIYWAE